MEKFSLKKLHEVEGKEQYRVKISYRFAALENLDDGVDISRASETIGENIKMSAKASISYELKKHKPWFDEEYSKLLDQKIQAKLQWLQNRSQIIGDNFNNIRREASRYFQNKTGISERRN
jgi:hypothetical protein